MNFKVGIKLQRRVVAAFLTAVLAASGAASHAENLWVSPTANAHGEGTSEAPFQSIEHAMTKLAELRARNVEVINVYLDEGIYRLSETLVFDPDEFGGAGPQINFMPYSYPLKDSGSRPVISGGVEVVGWEKVPLGSKGAQEAFDVYRASVDTDISSRQFYVNGRRAQRARTESIDGHLPAGFRPFPVLYDFLEPGKDSFDVKKSSNFIAGGGIQFTIDDLNPSAWRDPCKWDNVGDIEAVINTQWKMMRVPLSSEQSIGMSCGQKGLLKMEQPAWTNANLFFNKEENKPGIWSFWQVSWFENALQFLDQPGEWYFDKNAKYIYYIPRPDEDISTLTAEFPVLETLVKAHGTPEKPIKNISFKGITFSHATWLSPSGQNGYVADQSGFHVVGDRHSPNYTGHVKDVERTPGNLSFTFSENIQFQDNLFLGLGAVALDFGQGSKGNAIEGNRFDDVASAAIQMGGVSSEDRDPTNTEILVEGNRISRNVITNIGQDYVDAAGIFIGFSKNTEVSFNTIANVPWSGIAIGWGWGLLDKGMFPGLANAKPGMWGTYTDNTPNSGNSIKYNLIVKFLENRWDGGAIYSTGQQGTSMNDPLLIEGNVAVGKRPKGGGNTFYTDGGSRYVLLSNNVSFDNPIGTVDMGPSPRPSNKLPYPDYAKLNFVPYGSDIGGCRTFGDIEYVGNYWLAGDLPEQEEFDDLIGKLIDDALKQLFPNISADLVFYSKQGFFNICPMERDGVSYPTNLTYRDNHKISGLQDIPSEMLSRVGHKKDAIKELYPN